MIFFALSLLLIAAPAEAQHRVAGRVTDAANGQALPGVQVVVQGTTVGALTDQDGRYSLTAPSGQGTLVFSRVGYAPLEAPIGDRPVVNAQLATEAIALEGIVAVGYGEKSRVTLTESIGTVSAEQVERQTIASADQAIQGRVTGVQVVSESGTPGAPVAVRIRGVGTVGNTQPLYVVDGVPVGKGTAGTSSPLATINPNDIESISVLKDASAASVYGMQAANGVVLITTKRGQVGKPTIRYDAYAGVQRFPKYYELNNTAEWLELEQEAIDAANAYFGRQPGDDDYVLLSPVIREGSPRRAELLARNTDWNRVGVNDNAPIMNHNVSVSGASENVNYYVSAGYFEQEAVVDKWDLQRYSFRANSDFTVNDWFRFGETFSLSNQYTFRGHNLYGDGAILNNTVTQAPIAVAYDPSLVSPTNPQGLSGNEDLGQLMRPNLNSVNQLVDVDDRTTRVLGSLFGEFDLIEGLTFRTQGSVDYGINSLYYWQPYISNAVAGYERTEVSEDQRNDSYSIVWTNTANYDLSVGQSDINLLGGVEAQQFRTSGLSLQTTDFVNELYNLRRITSLGSTVLKKGGFAGEDRRLGFIGRLSYDYADRYLLTASLRRDGVSTFAPGHQWGTFPAVSAGWRISEEPFFNVPWVNELKVRGSWGQLGNSEISGGAYPQYVSVLLWADYALGDEQVRLAPTPQPRLANEELTWETNETVDFGFETVLLNNSVDLAVTYYTRDTENFLLSIPVPSLSGFTSAPINVGSMNNSGWEVEAGYTTVFRGVDLNISGNFTTVNNELTALTEGIEEYNTSGGIYRTAVGQPVGYFYGYKTCGIFQTDEAAASAYTDMTIGSNTPQAGDMCFQDLDGDGLITTDDRTYLGKTLPDMFFGFNVNAAFRNFDFTAFFNGVQGVQRYNQLRRSMEAMWGGYSNQLATTQDRWTPDNPDASLPRAIAGDPAGNARLISDRWVEDADYLRLKTLQVGYTLPDNFLGTNGTRLYLSATNLWTLTDYSGLDPEFSTPGNAYNYANNQSQLASGTDVGNIPQPRMFQIGVTTTF